MRLKEIREKNNLLQKEVANALKIKQQQYSEYEVEKRQMSIEKLIEIANFYNTSTDYILNLTDEEKPYPKKKTN